MAAVVWTPECDDTSALRVLLQAAEDRNEVGELLAIRDRNGHNVLHFVQGPAQVRVLLAALTSLTLPAACKPPIIHALPELLPYAIREVVVSFLPYPVDKLLNQQTLLGGRTPMMSAVPEPPTDEAGNALAIIQLLIDAGADPNLTDSWGCTALDDASETYGWYMERFLDGIEDDEYEMRQARRLRDYLASVTGTDAQ